MRVDAPVCKVGILEYEQPDGTVIREYNPPEVLQDAAFLEALDDLPVTREHPPVAVTPENYGTYNRGTTRNPRFDGTYALTRLAIQDALLITDVANDVRTELSLGYMATVDYTPGETPDGEKYDGIRTSITPNHVAVVTRGRAGPDVRLRLDSAGDTILVDTSETPEKPGMTPEQIAKLQADLAAAQGRADAAESSLASANERLAAHDKARVDALRAKAKALRPTLAAKIDTAEEPYLAAVIEAAEVDAPAAETPAPVETPKADVKEEPTAPVVADSAPQLSARERMLRRNRGEKI